MSEINGFKVTNHFSIKAQQRNLFNRIKDTLDKGKYFKQKDGYAIYVYQDVKVVVSELESLLITCMHCYRKFKKY